jgi:hypothetical protein
MKRPMTFAGLGALAVGLLTAVTGTGSLRTRPVEPVAAVAPEPAWTRHLAAADAALAENDVSRAVSEWRRAYSAALGTRRWEPMAAVGDAAMRIDGSATGLGVSPLTFRGQARQAYLTALWSARSAGSREGVERIAAAFAALGDADTAARVGDIVLER